MEASFLLLLAALGVIATIPAYIAYEKGYDFATWWLYGVFLWIIALIHALCLKPTAKAITEKQIESGSRKCPSCAEWIKTEAKVCRYCGRDV